MSFLSALSSLQFEVINLIGALIVLLIALPFLFKKQFAKGSTLKTKYSSIKNIKNIKPNLKVRLRNIPFFIRLLTILSLALGFSHLWVVKIIPTDY